MMMMHFGDYRAVGRGVRIYDTTFAGLQGVSVYCTEHAGSFLQPCCVEKSGCACSVEANIVSATGLHRAQTPLRTRL